MKVSIITVVYNNDRTIEETIISVLSQSYFNIEYIIIDGGSNDNTINIINKYSDKLDVVISEPDFGIYDAMNKGINLATGEIIGILNSDDIFEDCDVVKLVVSQFILDKNLDIYYGDLVYVDYDDLSRVIRYWESSSYYNYFFEDGNVPPHPTIFLKKEVYNVAGRFNLDFKLASDYEFMLRIFKNFNFKSFYSNSILVRMRLGGATNKSIYNMVSQNFEIYNSWKLNGLSPPILLMPLRFHKRILQFLKA